ncbi:telomeric repeat-binding factor 2-interacting protein 1 [Parambassis ranga]|uniref:Telomeric repeat-binding factor 2-interacting protein 1 n=1 Tax=Parambassis ranga TaxID=210632 RepID=A0A6P7HYS4_9TELE|nr:telomeric repeat-binding factor 2-interacting protein 1 [Parambassis ranga]
MAQSSISPVLFLMVDGEPMSFFLRPGPVKRKLQPLITAGGGMLCNVQQPGAILLIHPDERNTIPESAAHWYVSTQYIYDCIEKEEQLNLEDYKLNPEIPQKHSTRYSKGNSSAISGGRVAYTPEEDAAILNYVSKHKTDIGGNRLWQEMETERVTCHSWQSMKYRYRVRLAKLQLQAEEVETKEEDNQAVEDKMEVEDNKKTDVQKPSCEEHGAPQTNSTETDTTQLEGNQETDVQKPSCEDDVLPQTHSAEMDPTQMEVEPTPAENIPESEDPQIYSCLHVKGQHINQQTEQPAESMQPETVEAETSDSPQAEGPDMDSLTDSQLISAETTQPKPCQSQTADTQQEQNLPEDSISNSPKMSTSKKLKEKQKPPPQLEQPQQRMTRRKLALSSSPELYGKRLRSSSTQPEEYKSSPRTSRKTKTALKPTLQKDTTTDHPPPKRGRIKIASPAVAEESQEESGEEPSGSDGTASETPQADETNPALQKADKKKEKRQLGILELATKEFEDGSESDEDQAIEVQNPSEKTASSKDLLPPQPDKLADPASPQSDPEPGPSRQENVPKTGCPDPAAPGPAVSEAVSAASKAHLFIFESQEDNSQSVLGDRPTAAADPQPTVNKDAAFSLTQVQLEEDKQRITELMDQTEQDLVTVTKALLKTSGDFSAALNLLSNPSCVSGPFWNRHDDSLVLSHDPAVRRELQEKYGEEGVAKRIMFLEVEG